MYGSLSDIVKVLTGNRLPVLQTTSADLAVNHPFLLETGILHPLTGKKVLGDPIGTCGENGCGGIMYYDPVQLFLAEIIEATNDSVWGMVGQRKSTSIKTRIQLGVRFGKNFALTDPKGEYEETAASIEGSKVLDLASDDTIRLNLLDNSLDGKTQLQLVKQVTVNALEDGRTTLNAIETSMLWYGLIEAHRQAQVPVIGNLVELLGNPTNFMSDELMVPADQLARDYNHLRLALKRLDTGDLRSSFHEPTTPGLFDIVPLLVMKLKGLEGVELGIMLLVLNFLLSGNAKQRTGRFHNVIHDEAWKVAGTPGWLESVVASYKLGNSEGVSTTIVGHHPNNLIKGASSEIVRSVFSDTTTTIMFRLDPNEAAESAELVGLNDEELRIVSYKLQKGEALYKIGDLPGIRVQHHVSDHPLMQATRETRKDFRGMR
jgi:hypothetical protein